MNPPDDEILTEREASALVREGERTFRNRRYAGTGPAYIHLGRRSLYRRQAVLDWLTAHEVHPAT